MPLILTGSNKKFHHFENDHFFLFYIMAGANPGGLNQFDVAHNAIYCAGRDHTINVTTFHNRGHLNTGLDPTKSSVSMTRVCPLKLVFEIVRNYRTSRHILERDRRYSSEYEAEFRQAIGTLQNGSGTGRFVYIKIRDELSQDLRLNFPFFVSTLTVTAAPRLNVENGPNTRKVERTIDNATVVPDW